MVRYPSAHFTSIGKASKRCLAWTSNVTVRKAMSITSRILRSWRRKNWRNGCCVIIAFHRTLWPSTPWRTGSCLKRFRSAQLFCRVLTYLCHDKKGRYATSVQSPNWTSSPTRVCQERYTQDCSPSILCYQRNCSVEASENRPTFRGRPCTKGITTISALKSLEWFLWWSVYCFLRLYCPGLFHWNHCQQW